MPSPESPAKRMTTWSSSWSGCSGAVVKMVPLQEEKVAELCGGQPTVSVCSGPYSEVADCRSAASARLRWMRPTATLRSELVMDQLQKMKTGKGFIAALDQ